MRFRAPASSANLGPGFDALAVALCLHVEVAVDPAPSLQLSATGEGAELAAEPEKHLAVRVVRSLVGHDSFAIRVNSSIPVGRGLGSSAALAAAAAAAAGSNNPLAVACGVDGHPENAAASVMGGLVAAATVDGEPVARRLPLDPGLAFVVLVPERPLPTEEARAVLPEQVPLTDAAANLGRMGLLIAGLADRSLLVAAAMEDRLHQDARNPLFPEARALIESMKHAGALAASWSGAGPSLIGVCDADGAEEARIAGETAMAEHGVRGRAMVLKADFEGLVET